MASEEACRDPTPKAQEADKMKMRMARTEMEGAELEEVVGTTERTREAAVAVIQMIQRRTAAAEYPTEVAAVAAAAEDVEIALEAPGCREGPEECPSKTKLHPRKSAETTTTSNLTDKKPRSSRI